MELLREIWATARRNKLRTGLTGFAVAWGIFMLIFLLGAGNGLINANMAQMDRHIANSMVLFGGSTSKYYDGLKEGRKITLEDKDLTTMQKSFSDKIELIGGEIMESNGQSLSYGQNYVTPSVKGVDPSFLDIEKIKILCGRFINPIDMRDNRKVIVINKKTAKELRQDWESMVGEYVKLNNLAFRVIGIYKEDDSRQDNEAYTAFTTFKTMYGKGDDVGSIIFSFHGVNTKEDNEAFEKDIHSKINRNHRAAPDDDGAIWIWNRYDNYLNMLTGIDVIRTALWVIGLLTLLSGIVGVSNIMLITVKERTHEFGIRKAIGAKPRSILRLIIVESVIITSLFGYIGMMLGIFANEWMDATMGHESIDTGLFKATMFLNPTVGLDVCIEATLVIVIAGTIAGLIPAYKAAHIRPIEALNAD